jgi:hypothetical protein
MRFLPELKIAKVASGIADNERPMRMVCEALTDLRESGEHLQTARV